VSVLVTPVTDAERAPGAGAAAGSFWLTSASASDPGPSVGIRTV